jgi:hypothetical protein
MKTGYKLLSILFIGLLVFSCEKEPVEPENDPENVQKNTVVVPDFLDIADSRTLVAVNGTSSKKSSNGNPHSNGNLYKVKDNGDFIKVMFRDQNGKPFEKIVYYKENGDSIVNYPVLIIEEINELNDEYLLVEGTFDYLDISDLDNPQQVYYESLLLRVSDGALFNFDDKINWYRSCRYKNRYLYTDLSGNVYYTSTSSNNNVQKLSTHQNGSITRENILPYNQQFKSYCVDGDGNLFYQPDDMGSTFEGFYIKAADNGIIQFNTIIQEYENDTLFVHKYTDYQWMWIGEDGSSYAVMGKDSMVINKSTGEWDAFESGRNTIVEFAIDHSDLQYENHLTGMDALFEDFQWHIDQYTYRSSYQNETIFLYGNVGQEPATKIWSLDLVSNAYRSGTIPINEGEYISAMIHDGSAYIYIAVNSKLLKISKEDFSYTSFLPENQYDIFALSVSDDDVVTFNALRYSDAKIVLGEIATDGVISITKDDMEEPVTTLVRIN